MLVDKCKPCEVHRRMCDVLVKKMFTNGLKMGFPLQTWVEKTVHGLEIYWLSGKKKVPGTVVSKEGHCWTWKKPSGTTVKSAFKCQILRQNSPNLLNDLSIYLGLFPSINLSIYLPTWRTTQSMTGLKRFD